MELFWSFELHWILNCRPDSSLTSSLAGEILNCQPCTEHILLLGLHLEPNWGCWHIEPFKEGSSLAVDIFCLSVLDPRMPHTMVIKSTRTLYSELERYQAIRQKLSPIFVVIDFFFVTESQPWGGRLRQEAAWCFHYSKVINRAMIMIKWR